MSSTAGQAGDNYVGRKIKLDIFEGAMSDPGRAGFNKARLDALALAHPATKYLQIFELICKRC